MDREITIEGIRIQRFVWDFDVVFQFTKLETGINFYDFRVGNSKDFDNWINHLRSKNWFTEKIEEGLKNLNQ